MQLLIDHKHGNVLRAFAYACRAHDTTSARLLLSAEAAIPSNPRRTQTGEKYYFDFIKALYLARDDLSIFRLAAEEIWSRRDILTGSLLDYLEQEHMQYLKQRRLLPVTINAVQGDFGMPSPHGTKQAMADPLSSAVHMSTDFGPRHHQILFDVGFTDVDTQCGPEAMTPLYLFCQNVPRHVSTLKPENDWSLSVLWLLRVGANPRLSLESSGGSRHSGKYVQHFLAMALNLRVQLLEGFVDTLGRLDERYMRDDCSCRCSSKGCIPSSGLWRNPGGWFNCVQGITRQCLARSTSSTRKWLRYWGYSRSEKDFIYQEASRHEIFHRLGMTHLCCVRIVGMDDIPHIRVEDEESARNLELLLQCYLRLRKAYSKIPIESFWAYWWGNIDTILPPVVDFSSHEKEIVWMNYEDVPANKEDMERTRDDRWRAALEKAGYKNWDYKDVIRDHCTKMLLKARAYKEKEIAWKRHRLVTKPRFVRKRPSKSSNVQSVIFI
ncbi:hypothetical protein BJ166DRAFT_306463 [Pestalotiopsis sp. NC0098]|nr:hypothetical protein BJ166DRAFT_306463 [Pestalotiopsis sp. NC0098]